MPWLLACLHILLLAAGFQRPAHAHLMPAGQGAVNVVGDSAYAVIAVPAAALSGFDDNRDGLIDAAEINAHRAWLDSQLNGLLQLRSGEEPGRLVFADLLLSHIDEPGFKGSDHVVVARRYRWSKPVESFTLRVNAFGLPATRNAQLLVRAIRGERSEAAVLSAHRSDYVFFAGPWVILRNFAVTGAEHILLGADHLLFLLTILVVGAGWRYWLAVITSFTIAHSITLTLAALGWVSVPASVVEPLIAASIVLLAVDNLVRGPGANKHRIALVFGCGLLHGLGIASVLSDIGLSGGSRALSLLGFNLGVEFGQMLFVAAALGVLYAVRRAMREAWHGRVVQACSLAAALIGSGWMVQRVMG
ncbi:MAG TPA: HupE/UreJ family protein [Paucimonas sp.]|nr:HupE/UreJ family protein [Paucimonas sp.]